MKSSVVNLAEGLAVWVINTPTKAARLTSVRARITWTKRPSAGGGLGQVNRRLAAGYAALLHAAEANTVRLIGRTRL
jgi:hypothetical protein